MDFDNRLHALANHMADEARIIAKQYFRKGVAVENKNDASPVTLADRAIEKAMRALIEESFPDHGIIGEEFGAVRGEAEFQWVLDPIDGTRAFIAGLPTFVTLIALCKNGLPVLGIIDQPISGERWVSAAAKNTVSRISALSQATIATTSTHYFTAAQSAAFAALQKQCGNCVLGGDAYSYGMLASGHIDLVADAGMKPYDFCALRPVVEAAGGVISDWQGKPLTLHSDGSVLAAATKELHAKALSILSLC
jgi:histidinol phosphatase-like enzyme (inositol monophosphatase family)